MRTILANPKIVSSSDFYVRIRAFDGELPVNIDVERAAIDNVAGVSPSSNEFRWRIVETNLRQLVAVAESRHIQGAVTEGSSLGGKFLKITLRETDLRRASIRIPEPQSFERRTDGAARASAELGYDPA